MASTNKTEALGLSQFIDTDKPTWRGDYNGDMRKLDVRAQEDTSKFNSFETRIKAAETTVDADHKVVAQIDQKIGEAESRAKADAASQVAKCYDDLFTKVSDRYTKAQSDARYILKNSASPDSGAVIVGTSNVVQGKWPTLMCRALSIPEHNFAVGGTGMVNGANNFSVQLNRAIADGSFSNSDIKYVIIADCGNDAMANNDVYNGLVSLISDAKRAFPNARVVVFSAVWAWSNLHSLLKSKNGLAVCLGTMQEVCGNYGAEYVSTEFWCLGYSKYFTEGEIHLNSTGDTRFATLAGNYLQYGNEPVAVSTNYRVGLSGLNHDAGAPLTLRLNGGIVSLSGIVDSGGTAIGDGHDWGTIPEWAAPRCSVNLQATGGADGRTPIVTQVHANQHIQSWTGFTGRVQVSGTWSIL
jgi:hypothetical protein|nr:MAG TPA: SGNH-hydrolase family esterase [Caudoviricetes sp.]